MHAVVKKEVLNPFFSLIVDRMGQLILSGVFLALGFSVFSDVPVITTPPAAQTVFIGDPVSFSVSASGTTPLEYQWFQNGVPVEAATQSTLTFVPSASDDDALFSVQVANGSGSITSDSAALIIDFGMGDGQFHTNRFIEITSPWRYEVSKTDLGPTWMLMDDVDESWALGGGLLYVESSGLPAPKTTALPLTTKDLPTTCYFHTSFTNTFSDAYSMELVANTVVDDGMILYLNGTELLRHRMAEGTVAYGTASSSAVGNAVFEGPFELDGSKIVNGENLLAVEVHQYTSTSSDIVMGMTLDAVWQGRLPDTVAPLVEQTTPVAGSSVSSLTQMEVVFNEGVLGVAASDLLINGVAATSVLARSTSDYLFQFVEPATGTVTVSWASGHGITDRSIASHAFVGADFSYQITSPQLPFLRVFQSSDATSETTAALAVDDLASSFSLTGNLPGSYWMGELGRPFPCDRIELVNRAAPDDAEMEGLTLTVFNMDDQVVFETVLSNPGPGETLAFSLPSGIPVRSVRLGLSGNQSNGAGNNRVGVAEVRLFGLPNIPFSPEPVVPGGEGGISPPGNNLARSKRSFMLRIADSDAPSSNVNDGDYATEARTTSNAFDGYWEVDLGATYALYGVRAIAPADLAQRLGYTILRLFDEEHNSVHSRPVDGTSTVFEIDLNGPVFARYVRIGLEDKTRPNENNRANKYEIGFNEVEVFGRSPDAVGIMSLTASESTVASGQSITLDWSVVDVKRVELYPGLGSVGAQTETNGTGSLPHIMTESTEFIMVATNNAGIFTRAVGVEVDGAPLSVRINEVVADNLYSMEDGYGNAPDWIELRNTGNSPVDLTGWGLSDNASKPMKWVFPVTNIPPHSTLIVFASNKELAVDPEGNLHADFSLQKDGESLYLTAADAVTTMDSIAYPELDTDLSYGRDLQGNWTLMEPTPGAVNTGESYSGWLRSLHWSHARGFYETDFTLSVTGEDPAATILYSLDGAVPSIPYTEGLRIEGTSSVRIQPVQAGYRSPPIQTKTFIFLDDVITSPLMNTGVTQDPDYAGRLKPGLLDLPAISLVVPGTPAYPEQACSMEILWTDGQNPIQQNCGISVYGGAVQTFDKESFQLAFRSEYGNGKLKAPLFNGFDRGRLAKTSFDKLQLSAGNQDRTTGFYMSDRFVQDSLLEMGRLNPHGRFVHVYLNGAYWGQYNCREMFNDRFLADYLGGEEDEYVEVKGNNNDRTGITWSIGVGTPPDPEPWERIRALRTDFDAVRPYLDVSHFIDVMLLWGYGGCEQEFKACGPRDAGSGYKIWLNDSDRFLVDRSNDRLRNTVGPGYIWSGLHSEGHIDFKMLLADRIYKNFFNHGPMTPAACDARLVTRMDEVRDSFIAESARWGYLSVANWESKAATIRNSMFPYRTDELIAQWRSFGYLPPVDPPAFNRYGGAVLEGFQPELTSTDGNIYYTLDGSDPRLPGGAIATSALVWVAGALTVTEDVTMMVRVRAADGTWSALADPRYLLGSRQSPLMGDLLVTEVNYNPDGSDDFEFVEIWNSGTNLLDLSGVTISNGVRYLFPEFATLLPGETILVAEDALAFSNRYQHAASPWYWDGIRLSGEWVGGLRDGGEAISLVASNGTLITTVDYRSDGDWPERPDGGGSSLELEHPTRVPDDAAEQAAYLSDGRSWTASSLYHGSPGRFDGGAASVVINEVIAHTDVGVDWIELYNSGSGTADLSSMALTDTLALPMRYPFAAGTTLSTNSYLIRSASTLGFGFSELGSSAYLLELSGTDILRFVDHVSFPAVEREEPFGRYQRTDGIVDFTELLAISPSAENALPRVGPVVISEIMFVPEPGRSEYVEIHNISDATVPLYDESIPSNTWSLTGVGVFAFPKGISLEPNETVILCATNPAAFRAQYGVDASTTIFGPWTGGLAREGEKLTLRAPGDPEPDGTIPQYRVDHVSYRTNAYWAVANSGGVSLERRPLNGYGNDPISWRSSLASGSPGVVMGESYPMGMNIQLSGTFPMIAFRTVEGDSYEVRYTDSLTDPEWKLLEHIPSASSNWIEIFDWSPSASNRFYRILWNW